MVADLLPLLALLRFCRLGGLVGRDRWPERASQRHLIAADLPEAPFDAYLHGAVHEAPDRWGDMRAHVFWGAAYHAVLLSGNRGYPGFRPHRDIDHAAAAAGQPALRLGRNQLP